MYCKREIPQDAVVDICKMCGIKVWGEKMFDTIVNNMEEARDRGDLLNSPTEQQH